MKNGETYVCLNADVLASAGRKGREELSQRIESALIEANDRYREKIISPLVIGSGHEWRGVLCSLPVAFEIDLFLRHRLFPVHLTTGIGRGDLNGSLEDDPARLGGSSILRSRKGLERARRQRGSTFLVSGDPILDAGANAISLLLHTLFESWTSKQLEAYLAYRRHGTEANAAESIGITQSALHQRLAAAHAKTYEQASEQLLWFVDNFPAIFPVAEKSQAS